MTFGERSDIKTYSMDIGDGDRYACTPRDPAAACLETLNKGLSYVGFGRAQDDECWRMASTINWDRLEAINNHHAMPAQRQQDRDYDRSSDRMIVEYGHLAKDDEFKALLRWLDASAEGADSQCIDGMSVPVCRWHHGRGLCSPKRRRGDTSAIRRACGLGRARCCRRWIDLIHLCSEGQV